MIANELFENAVLRHISITHTHTQMCVFIMWETETQVCQVSCREHVLLAFLCACVETENHVCVGSVSLFVHSHHRQILGRTGLHIFVCVSVSVF